MTISTNIAQTCDRRTNINWSNKMSRITDDHLNNISIAFNNNDVEGITSFFAEEGAFINAVGPAESGDIYKGKQAIHDFFANLFANMESLSWNIILPNMISADGQSAVTQWNRVGIDKDGNKTEWLGCDLYQFKDGLIIKKDTYIKVVK